MKIRCIVIDDEPIARRGMQEYIAQVGFLELAGVFENPQKAYALLGQQHIDLIFLDIEMPKLSGIDFLKSLDAPPLIIVATAYPEYAVEGYELDVVDYLVKPVPLPRFLKAVNKANDILSTRLDGKMNVVKQGGYFFVKENGKFIRVLYEEVLFAEALQNYVAIHLPERRIVTYITLSVLEKQLPAAMFMRVHKSYIVSLDKISSIDGNTALVGLTGIPVSRKIKDQLVQRVLDNKLLKR